jgi:hypothetical protein
MKEQEAKEQISYIKRVIDDSMSILSENGLYYVLWGALTLAGACATLALLETGTESGIVFIWVAVCVLGFSLSFALSRRARVGRIATPARRAYASIWVAIGVFGLLFGICAGITGKIPLEVGLALCSGLLGISYFVSSVMSGNKWMRAFAFGWWAGSVIQFLLAPRPGLALMCFMILAFELIPGIVLYRHRRAAGAAKGRAGNGALPE